MKKILVVDDNREWRLNLAELLVAAGYDVEQASGGEAAIRVLHSAPPDLVISDLLMPGVDGFELCLYARHSKALQDIPFIFCSGFFPEKEQQAMLKLLGVTSFFTKPVDFDAVIEAIEVNLRSNQANSTNDAQVEHLASFSNEHEKLVQSKLWEAVERERKQRELAETLAASLERSLEGFVYSLSKVVEARDPYTAGHQLRVSKLAVAIAKALLLPEAQRTGVRFGALIHDLGKIAVPSEMLVKPSGLADIEFQMIQTHAEVGFKILEDIDSPWPLSQIAYQHHERINGSGYPQGLKGDDIIIEAKIVAVADVVEAMVSHRPYRAALGIDAALEELRAGRGTLYDETIVDCALKLFAEGFTFVDEPE